MNWKQEWKKLLAIVTIFLACFYLPVGNARFDNAIMEALHLVKWYAQEHVLLCLIPAFFIAGAISVFVSQASVMKYLGARANKLVAYSVAAVSGTILAVCSCTILPLFAGIYRMGAGLGPACAFLYSGPAINILAIILTARILGLHLGVARAVGAILFSVVIGLLMALIFRKSEAANVAMQPALPTEKPKRALWQNGLYFFCMVGILVFANWARSGDSRAIFLCCPGGLQTYAIEGAVAEQTPDHLRIVDRTGAEHTIDSNLIQTVEPVESSSTYNAIYKIRWGIVAGLLLIFLTLLKFWFDRTEIVEWLGSSWSYATLILPLLFMGVLVAGFLLGRPGYEGIIPSSWVEMAVGGNSLRANLFASVAGAFMYFATLTEVPIVQGLMTAGMGKGPALALLLAGPALSLPNMFVIRSVMGTRKTVVFVSLVIVMATICGMIYGGLF